MIPKWLSLKDGGALKEKFILRTKILKLIRSFFEEEDFLETETPSLVRVPGMEPHLDPMKVILSRGKDSVGHLITSPEYAMKKLLAAGFTKIFQICKSFRGGEAADNLHNPEFTILEWYRARADYKKIMDDVERLFVYIARNLHGQGRAKSKLQIKYQNQIIDLSPPWPRLTVKEAFQKYAGINLDKALERESMARIARAKGYVVNRDDRFDDIFFKIFLSEIEPHLGEGRPTILYDWPAQMAALSCLKKNDQRYAERFEVYIGGLELGNAFSELVDPKEQKERLVEEKKLRKKLGKEVYDLDEDFLRALKDVPPSGGIAMGVDRIVMLFTDAKRIDEILFFPASQIFN
jgi:lysyl-tRNA synthetase class 2